MTSDPHWCHGTCGYMIRSGIVEAARDVGHEPPDLEMVYSAPLVMTPWWRGYECPHGNSYWIRPTGAQINKWNDQGIP